MQYRIVIARVVMVVAAFRQSSFHNHYLSSPHRRRCHFGSRQRAQNRLPPSVPRARPRLLREHGILHARFVQYGNMTHPNRAVQNCNNSQAKLDSGHARSLISVGCLTVISAGGYLGARLTHPPRVHSFSAPAPLSNLA